MARPPRGNEVLHIAQQQLAKASGDHELRVLQAVVFPLAYGMSIQETAQAVGRSPRWVTAARNSYIRNVGIPRENTNKVRNNAYLSEEEEKAFLVPFFDSARSDGGLIVNEIHKALEEHLGHKVALASAYNLLHRHGWRKNTPDKRNVEADVPGRSALRVHR